MTLLEETVFGMKPIKFFVGNMIDQIAQNLKRLQHGTLIPARMRLVTQQSTFQDSPPQIYVVHVVGLGLMLLSSNTINQSHKRTVK